MEEDANSELEPDMDSALKAIIDQTWLKLDTTDTGGGPPDGRWRSDS